MSEVFDFLERLHPGGPSTVAVYRPRADGATLSNDEAARWASERDGASDLYVLVGLAEGAPTTTPTKDQMRGSGWLWCDLDPRKERGQEPTGERLEGERERLLGLLTDRLPAEVPPPTVVVDSGRGYWGLWQLARPCLDAELVEACNRWLANTLGSDSVQNINRVMRLPGTVNLKTGQRSSVLLDEPERVCSIEDFHRIDLGPAADRVVDLRPVRVADLGELDVPDRVKVVVAQGRHPDEPPKEPDDSRSAWLFDAVCNLVRAGVPDEVVLGIITDPGWAISESVLDKGRGAERYALRQIEKARSAVAMDEADFQTNKDGVPYPNQHNIRLALAKLGVRLSHDQFADRLLVEGLPECQEPRD